MTVFSVTHSEAFVILVSLLHLSPPPPPFSLPPSLSPSVLVPFQEWVAEATSDVKRLFPLETDKKSLELARDRLLSIQDNARGKEPTVDKLSTLATQFAEKREVHMCRTACRSVCVVQNCLLKCLCCADLCTEVFVLYRTM